MQAQKMIPAAAMARAVQFDPQFAMPTRPSLPRELVVMPLANGLLIEGTDTPQVLRGQAAQSLLPRLFSLLDGTRTLEQLAAALPDVAATHIQQAVALLYTRGLLEDKATEPTLDPQRFDPQMLAFFRRHVDTTRANRSALEAAARLSNAEVVVYSTTGDQQRAEIVKKLRAAGLGAVTARDFGSAPTFSNEYANQLVIALVTGADDTAQLTALDAQCARLGVAWLRVAVQPEAATAELGPYFERSETACYQCFRQVEGAVPSSVRVTRAEAELQTKFWAAMLVTEVLYFLSRIGPLATGLQVKRYDLSNWSVQSLRYPRLPGCLNCRPVSGLSVGAMHTALVFEDAVRFPSRHLHDPKNHQVHYSASNLDLAKDSKRFPNVTKVPLPVPEQVMQVAGTTLEHLPGASSQKTAAPLTVEALASLLLLGGGVWSKEMEMPGKTVSPKRWAATGGNLGSVELFVAAYGVAGLEPGLYFYEVHEHQLARINSAGQAEVADFIRAAVPSVGAAPPAAMIISAGALYRVTQKYGSFAYRVINLDAGVALAQMQMVASSWDVQTRLAERWADDVIATQLDLRDLLEPVTGALLLNERTEK